MLATLRPEYLEAVEAARLTARLNLWLIPLLIAARNNRRNHRHWSLQMGSPESEGFAVQGLVVLSDRETAVGAGKEDANESIDVMEETSIKAPASPCHWARPQVDDTTPTISWPPPAS